MRKLIVQEFITIDGFAATETGGLDFMPQASDKDAQRSVEDNQWQFLDRIDTMVIGRNTYQMFVGYWPEAQERIAPKLNALNKIVCSTTIRHAPWGNHSPAFVIRADVPGKLRALKKEDGKDIVIWGSIQLVHSLIETALVDEYQLFICPSVIGKGRPLFPESASIKGMRLATTKAMDGFVLLQYEVTK